MTAAMNKHTYNPWQYAIGRDGTSAIIVDGEGSTVAIINVTENTTAHTHLVANVKLMAAAPALLEALCAVCACDFNSMSSRQEMVRLAEVALARATGVSK